MSVSVRKTIPVSSVRALPLLAYHEGHDAFANHAFVVAPITFVGDTNADGYITVNHKPIIARRRLWKANGEDLDIAADIAAVDGSSNQLYAGDVNSSLGRVRLYTDAGLTTPAANKVGCQVKYWYPAPMEGTVNSDGTFRPKVSAELLGSILVEQFTEADAVNNVLTFTENIASIEIYHEEAEWQDFIVNGLTLKIPGGGYRTPVAGTPSTDITIPANVSCVVGRLE